MSKAVRLDKIRFDGDTQMREVLNGETVAEYRDAMKAGDEFPPIVVFFDGSDYWIGDGYHRWHAAGESGADKIACDVRQGSRRDAILFACSANSVHGMRRTNADKRKAVSTLLHDAEWVTWSDNEISKACGVSQPFVGKLRERLITVISSPSNRRGKDGKSRKAKAKPQPQLKATVAESDEPAEESAEQQDFASDPAAINEPEQHPLYVLIELAQRHDIQLAAVIERWPYLACIYKQRIHTLATIGE